MRWSLTSTFSRAVLPAGMPAVLFLLITSTSAVGGTYRNCPAKVSIKSDALAFSEADFAALQSAAESLAAGIKAGLDGRFGGNNLHVITSAGMKKSFADEIRRLKEIPACREAIEATKRHKEGEPYPDLNLPPDCDPSSAFQADLNTADADFFVLVKVSSFLDQGTIRVTAYCSGGQIHSFVRNGALHELSALIGPASSECAAGIGSEILRRFYCVDLAPKKIEIDYAKEKPRATRTVKAAVKDLLGQPADGLTVRFKNDYPRTGSLKPKEALVSGGHAESTYTVQDPHSWIDKISATVEPPVPGVLTGDQADVSIVEIYRLILTQRLVNILRSAGGGPTVSGSLQSASRGYVEFRLNRDTGEVQGDGILECPGARHDVFVRAGDETATIRGGSPSGFSVPLHMTGRLSTTSETETMNFELFSRADGRKMRDVATISSPEGVRQIVVQDEDVSSDIYLKPVVMPLRVGETLKIGCDSYASIGPNNAMDCYELEITTQEKFPERYREAGERMNEMPDLSSASAVSAEEAIATAQTSLPPEMRAELNEAMAELRQAMAEQAADLETAD